MFVQLSAVNFKCLREEACFSLIGANITEYRESLIRNDEDTLGILPVSFLYGANGSGKSTVLKAISFLKRLAEDPVGAMRENIAFYGNEDEAVSLDFILRSAKREFRYIIKIRKGLILEEKLFGSLLEADRYSVLFDRDESGAYLAENLDSMEVADINAGMPLLSAVIERMPADAYIEDLKEQIEKIHYVNAASPGDEEILKVLSDADQKELFLHALSCVQSRIADVYTEDGAIMTERDDMDFLLEELGDGLQQMIRLFALAVRTLASGGICLLDDANQKLHPKAFCFLIGMFTDPAVNDTGAQLIGTSYDMPTMANSVLRRDEIWMTDCAEDGQAVIYPLALFLKENGEKVRKDETYFKQFLEGRYGTDIAPAALK